LNHPSIVIYRCNLDILFNEIKQLKQKFYFKDGTRTEVGLFSLGVSVDHLFFIGAQLVALSPTGVQ
jgi:hypothetical protein